MPFEMMPNRSESSSSGKELQSVVAAKEALIKSHEKYRDSVKAGLIPETQLLKKVHGPYGKDDPEALALMKAEAAFQKKTNGVLDAKSEELLETLSELSDATVASGEDTVKIEELRAKIEALKLELGMN